MKDQNPSREPVGEAKRLTEDGEITPLVRKMEDRLNGAYADLTAMETEVERLTTALRNIRERCFDDSEWGRYIDRVLKASKTPALPRVEPSPPQITEPGEA